MVSVRACSAAVLTAALLLGSTPASAAPTLKKRASIAARFLVTNQEADGSVPALSAIGSTADAVLSWVAVRRGPRAISRALDYLEANSDEVDTVGEKAKVVEALVAGGRDPRHFAGRDLVAEIESSQQFNGRYGAATPVFTHSLAMLGLGAAGGSPTFTAATQWLVDAQCDDGGWQYLELMSPAKDEHCSAGPGDIDESNTDTTALAVQALEGLPVPVPPNNNPFEFFAANVDPKKGGWGYDRISFGPLTNANSTGMVLQAYGAAELTPPRGTRRALARLQGSLCGQNAGSFYYTWQDGDGDGRYERSGRDNLAATIAAIPGCYSRDSRYRPPSSRKHRPSERHVER